MRLEELDFTPPGPGMWFADPEHSPRPYTEFNRIASFDMLPGFRIGAARYGQFTDGLMFAFVHRFLYVQPRYLVTRPPGPEDTARATFDALVAANPEIQERIERAGAALASKRWLTDLAHWDAVGKPWLMGRTLALTDLDPGSMSNEDLCDHIDEALHHLGRANEYHHILNPIASSARGLLFLRLYQWAGIEAREVEPLFVGSSPISAGDEPEMRALVAALANDPAALHMLDAEEGPEARLKAVAARGGATGDALETYLRIAGYRTTFGWEPMEPYALENPALIIDAIRKGLEGEYATTDEEAVAAIRERLPASQRAEFDELLHDARACSRVRDERDIYCNVPAGGLLRRAVIEAGRRAADAGRIEDSEHMTEATPVEIRSLILEGSGPAADVLRERHRYRLDHTVADIPPFLGDAALQQPVPLKWLPEPLQVFARKEIAQRGLASRPATPDEDEKFHGSAASPGLVEGTARVLLSAEDLGSIQQGDILVTTATSPAFNLVLPRLRGLVVEHGGMLSHAAIVAREYGIPAVIGVQNVTRKIRTGDRIRLDANNGAIVLIE